MRAAGERRVSSRGASPASQPAKDTEGGAAETAARCDDKREERGQRRGHRAAGGEGARIAIVRELGALLAVEG